MGLIVRDETLQDILNNIIYDDLSTEEYLKLKEVSHYVNQAIKTANEVVNMQEARKDKSENEY